MRRGTAKVELLGVGLYTPPEVARLVGLSPPTVRRWIGGYTFTYKAQGDRRFGHSEPIVTGTVPRLRNLHAIDFQELIEIFVVSVFLRHRVPMRTIRRASKRASEILDTPHPFATHGFKVFGKKIFLDDEFRHLLELADRQHAFYEILHPYLESVEFDPRTKLPQQWWPMGKESPIVLNPHIAFGEPVFAGSRLPVRTVLNALAAGEDAKAISYWYNISPEHVSAAKAFLSRGLAA